MSELHDIYVSKHSLAHLDDTGMLSIAYFDHIGTRERYTPHAKLKEVEDNWRMFALARLGVERDKMSPDDVEVIQKFLGVEHQP